MKLIKKFFLPLLALVLILPAIWPLFQVQFFHMHDFTHVARLVELDLALKAGQIPPRWAQDFGWGYGMPLFHFYPPLPYYLAEIFYLIKIPAIWAIKVVFALNFFLGFWFMYLYSKQFWGKIGAFVSAIAFVYLPYRAVQLYVRGSLGELMAMTFIPLFFYSVHQVIKTKKTNALIIFSLSLTGIFLSHNVIALFAVFFLPFYLLFFKFTKVWKKFVLGGVLALGLSAFFLIPAFFERQFTTVSSMTEGYSFYGFHFIYLRQLFSRRFEYGGSVLGPFDDISFQLGWPHVVLILPAIWLWLKKRLSILTVVFLSLGISIFMMTFHSRFIWDKLTILHLAQFPWRLLAFSSTYVAFLTGSIFVFLKPKQIKLTKGLAVLIITLIIGLNFSFFRPQKYLDDQTFYYSDSDRISSEMSDTLNDFMPTQAIKPNQPSDQSYETSTDISSFSEKTGNYVFTTNSTTSQAFILNQYNFPGWGAKINGQKAELQTEPILGRIKLDLPAGNHQVEIKMGKTQLQQWSDLISLLSWLILVVYWFTVLNCDKLSNK